MRGDLFSYPRKYLDDFYIGEALFAREIELTCKMGCHLWFYFPEPDDRESYRLCSRCGKREPIGKDARL